MREIYNKVKLQFLDILKRNAVLKTRGKKISKKGGKNVFSYVNSKFKQTIILKHNRGFRGKEGLEGVGVKQGCYLGYKHEQCKSTCVHVCMY